MRAQLRLFVQMISSALVDLYKFLWTHVLRARTCGRVVQIRGPEGEQRYDAGGRYPSVRGDGYAHGGALTGANTADDDGALRDDAIVLARMRAQSELPD